MKTIIYNLKTYISLVFLLSITTGYSQIVLNPNANTNTCNLDGDTVTVSVPSEALTGDNIALNITLPGSYDAACVKSVSITPSSNLTFQSSGAIPFSNIGGGIYQNDSSPTLNGNDGHNFNVFFKFPGFITCDGDVGTFDVEVTLDCGDEVTTCSIPVSVIARADNYWSVVKEYVTGNLTCGVSQWRVRVIHNNPNGSGLGTYSLTGDVTENPSVPVVNGSVFNFNNTMMMNNSQYPLNIQLQNCSPEGSVITNSAEYNFSLGDGCETMTGTVTADSDPLISPNADLSFTKQVRDNNGYWESHPYFNLSPGCSGYFWISVQNNGNVPWTDIEVTDNLNIPGITISNIQVPGGWTSNLPLNPAQNANYTFTAPPSFTLNPGEVRTIFIFFDVDAGTPIGSTIGNTASISYSANGSGSGGAGNGGSSPCPGINCPEIDTSIQNTTTSVDFEVSTPEPRASIKKCIINPPNSVIPPIYQIGDNIEFSIMVGSSGSADLSTVVSDALGMPGQNLQIDPGSISYEYYEDKNRSWRNSCNPNFGASSPPPFSIVENMSNLQDPTWTITDMPGICDYNKSNFLIITFEAEVLPQLFGTKTNTASIPQPAGTGTISSPVNYTIDQVGVLGVFKDADTEFVEDGQSFNYEITVSNSGSVPLNNLVITDMLPNCVSLNGQLSIEDAYSNSIPFTTSGNLVINVNSSSELVPGNDFTITIPVTKSGSGTCCNESVSITADMTTSGVALNANYGSEIAPAACVTGTECCEIDDFEASIQENNGSFEVIVNGGSVPLQEVEISMVDYHIEYAEEDCKPDDLGIFGTLTTTTTNLGNLDLNPGDNGTSSLTWVLGTPSIINSTVNLDILYPEVLNLECCDVEFYFCLKVKVKNVDCDDCETIICYSSENSGDPVDPRPCEIDIAPLEDSYCAGDEINLNWNTNTAGNLNIVITDGSNIWNTVVTNIPSNQGSFQYTIPNSIDCDKEWFFNISFNDYDGECWASSTSFKVDCCDEDPDCGCGKWLGDSVSIKGYRKAIPRDARKNINLQTNFEAKTNCGERIELRPNMNYSFAAPNYVCNPEDCEVEYKWEIVGEDGTILSGSGQNFNYTFNEAGAYKIIFTPICGGKECEPCVIGVIINRYGTAEPYEPHEPFRPSRN